MTDKSRSETVSFLGSVLLRLTKADVSQVEFRKFLGPFPETFLTLYPDRRKGHNETKKKKNSF